MCINIYKHQDQHNSWNVIETNASTVINICNSHIQILFRINYVELVIHSLFPIMPLKPDDKIGGLSNILSRVTVNFITLKL